MLDNKKGKFRLAENNLVIIGLSMVIVFLANILFNGWICRGNRVFYLDDLACIESFRKKPSLWRFLFSTGANKIRPVSQLAIGLVLKLAGTDYELIDEALLLFNFINAMLVFYFVYVIQRGQKVEKKAILSIIGALMFIASRFAYYNISELLGIMESVSLTLAIGILLLLYQYVNDGSCKKLWGATALYFLVIFAHERYFLLFICIIAAIIMQKAKFSHKLMLMLPTLFTLAFFWGIRILLFGNRAIDGTGMTSISDTFDIATSIMFCFSQVGYILGFNAGPQYLNGINATQVPIGIDIVLLLNCFAVLGMAVMYIRLIVKNQELRNKTLKNMILFILFIAVCIVCSSTTIRVEMRWIYVSYTAYVVMILYTFSLLLENYKLQGKRNLWFILILYFISILSTEQFYRTYYHNLYYWTAKDMARELYSETVEKYGKSIEGKEIIIVSKNKVFDSLGWQEDMWKKFFAPYVNSENMNVLYVDSFNDAEKILESHADDIVLFENLAGKNYADITEITNISRLSGESQDLTVIRNIDGVYEDWWCEPDCKLAVLGYGNQKMTLTFYYPDDRELIGSPTGRVIVNEENVTEFSLTGNMTTIEVPLSSEKKNTIQILSDYWVCENTDRSEDGRLSCVLTLKLSH